MAAGYRAAGVSEAAARIWSALAGLVLALLTAAIGRRWYDEATGRLAGAIVATCFGYFSIARLALPDLPLAACVTAAIYAVFRAAARPPPDGRARGGPPRAWPPGSGCSPRARSRWCWC